METIYVGPREAMIAEVSAFDPTRASVAPRNCRWLVLPTGDAQWDTDFFATRAEAMACARDLAAHYGAKINVVR